MFLSIPLEIAREIVSYSWQGWVATRQAENPAFSSCYYSDINPPSTPVQENQAVRSLLQLKTINRIFRQAVDEVLFQALEIKVISKSSLALAEGLLKSPTSRSFIQEYKFAPRVWHDRPVTSEDGLGYRDEFIRYYAAEPRPSVLQEIHERRSEGARRYDEQVEIMQTNRARAGRFWKMFDTFFHQRSASRLAELPYFSMLGDLPNLTCLRIGYVGYDDLRGSEDSVQYLIRNDMSAGLGIALAGHLSQLNRLVIDFPTLTDLQNIVHSANQSAKQRSTTSPHSIKCLEIRLDREGIPTNTIDTDYFLDVHFHISQGRAVSDLLGLFPELEDLSLSYNSSLPCDTGCHKLLMRDFDPPVLPNLRSVKFRSFIMTPSALRKWTLGDAEIGKMKLRTAYIEDVDLTAGALDSWRKILIAWADECLQPWQGELPQSPRFHVRWTRPVESYYSISCAPRASAEPEVARGSRYFCSRSEDGWRFYQKEDE